MLDGSTHDGGISSGEGDTARGWVWGCYFAQGVQEGLEEKVTHVSRPEEGIALRSSCIVPGSQVKPRLQKLSGSFP